MIKYIIDLGVDLECAWRPIHFICQYSTPQMIKYIIDLCVNLKCKTDEGCNPLFIIKFRNFNKTQKKLIGLKKVNILNLITYYKW